MIRLGSERRENLLELLRTTPSSNIFLLSVLHQNSTLPSAHTEEQGVFWGDTAAGPLSAVLYTTRGGLVVPSGRDADAVRRLGKDCRGQLQPRLLVGQRDLTDALWIGLDSGFVPRMRRDHRLYCLRRDQLTLQRDPAVRLALPRDLDTCHKQAADMQTEELGADPRIMDGGRFRRRVAQLIADGLLWILPVNDVISWQASAAFYCEEGSQIEAVYTPPLMRGRGNASRGLSGMCADLLVEYPLLTLHVNEENTAAIRLYERLGFRRDVPFRLIAR